MANRYPHDWKFLEINPVDDIRDNLIVRKTSRGFAEYLPSQILIFQTISTLIECFLPLCKGHQRFGTTLDGNVPVIFKYHDQNKEPVYVPYSNPICRPLRVPSDGDVILSGIKWKLALAGPTKVLPCILDCLIACLKDKMLSTGFCLECLFFHSNGIGLMFERFLKTILFHIAAYSRVNRGSPYEPHDLSRRRHHDMRLKRISWATSILKVDCHDTGFGFREVMNLISIMSEHAEEPITSVGVNFDPNTSILKHLDTVSRIDVLLRCRCNGGRSYPKRVYTGLLRKSRRTSTLYSIVMAQWPTKGEEYEDFLWNWSLLNQFKPSASVVKVTAVPIIKECDLCKHRIELLDVQVPDTTWCFMADLAEPLQRENIDGLRYLRNYTLGGVVFNLAFVLMYSKENGHFSSMNFFYEQGTSVWRLFDDSRGGLLQDTSPFKVKYNERINLRAFYFRDTGSNPHRCLQKAAARTAMS